MSMELEHLTGSRMVKPVNMDKQGDLYPCYHDMDVSQKKQVDSSMRRKKYPLHEREEMEY